MRSLFQALSVIVACTVTAALFAADDPLKWNKTPEAYFMTAAEKAEWKNVSSPEDARRFIDEFYRKRGEQFRKDVFTRIDIADKNFKLDKVRGSETQKGRVFMLLGQPNTSRTNREVEDTRVGISASNILENKALLGTQWVYERDHLPKELGISRLEVNFVYDARRGFESIDNLATVEPRLLQAAELISKRYMQATQTQTAARSMMPSAEVAAASDPLWNATPSLNGALFAGDAFLSAREEPFYAFTFFIPRSAQAFADWKSALLVTLVRNAEGRQVVSDRQQVDLTNYDAASGARFLDRSVLLPPGQYEGFFALYTPDGVSLLSSHRAAFEVAAPTAQRASALFLTSRLETLDRQDPLDPFTFVATKYAVRADRQFRGGEKIAFFTVISNPTGSPAPKLMQRMSIRRDGKEFAKTQLEPAHVTQTGPNTFLVATALDGSVFPAGHYSLVLQVHDFNAPEGSALRIPGHVLSTDFDVVP
ncbi:MAG TPA: GWxTD domain-containing protein [Thermoanaerobaculia bacterium]|nr:GWxTD domain-containing protein [Thermoanaerobaculia bacterium]